MIIGLFDMQATTLLLRLIGWTFAAVLGVLALWTAVPELIRPSLPYFPASAAASEQARTSRDAAALAGQLGLIRGDLWADDAVALSASLPGGIVGPNVPADDKTTNAARRAAERAASLAPHDSRAWLLLASLNARLGGPTSRVIAPLKMAYYTAPNDVALMPRRLAIAMHLDAFADQELQNMVGREIEAIVMRKTELKALIAGVYRDASPAGKQFLAQKLNQFDAKFLESMR